MGEGAARRRRWEAWTRGWRFVLIVWLASRTFFLVVGALADAFIETAWHENVLRFERPGALSYWATWDGAWYQEIATQGYTSTTATAFFPLYPALMWVGTLVVDAPAVWGVLISLVAFLAGLFFFYEIAEDAWGTDVARCSTLALAFFPTAFYFNAVYTEALFLALTTGTVWAARVRPNLAPMMIFGHLATLTRNAGSFVLIPIAAEFVVRRRRLWEALVSLAFIAAGLAAYMLFLWHTARDPVLFATATQQGWGRSLADPVTTLGDAWTAARLAAPTAVDLPGLFAGTHSNPALIASNAFNFVFLLFALALLIAGAFRLPLGFFLFAIALVVLPVLAPVHGFPLMSFPRYILGAFPLFYVLGMALARRRAFVAAWLAVSVPFAALLTLMFTTWRWVA